MLQIIIINWRIKNKIAPLWHRNIHVCSYFKGEITHVCGKPFGSWRVGCKLASNIRANFNLKPVRFVMSSVRLLVVKVKLFFNMIFRFLSSWKWEKCFPSSIYLLSEPLSLSKKIMGSFVDRSWIVTWTLNNSSIIRLTSLKLLVR